NCRCNRGQILSGNRQRKTERNLRTDRSAGESKDRRYALPTENRTLLSICAGRPVAVVAGLCVASHRIERSVNMIRFEHPMMLWALALLPVLLAVFLLYRRWRRKALNNFGDDPLVKRMMPDVAFSRPGW